ncbi:Sphingoid long-chain base transporter RSB1 [Colletotrichum orbiculare MAFF 240422]|uniref:Sphingoid long-chain base transporter RSB1 n=1 Tax=Colletotrichum orbiculare (strain 104-T / ATCC 96160 / CBS 514.97 / LARS 414 / MAFF 240422) TaxID=1213857 RepID=N4V2Y5_COLOR|nr:Sphingoid long-chain base transporter RSB1 [Colletotrichum orbiculare MAFF 240422]
MSATRLPNGLRSFGPKANCTLDLCPLEASLLRYQPSIPVNGAFIALFALAMVIHAVQGFRAKTWGFMASMIGGCLIEIIGYVGRLILHDNPFSFGGFLIQIICITVAPVFFCAAIYVMLSQVVNKLERSICRCNPSLFYYIFIPCDVISLVLQATGGALSSIAGDKSQVQIGVNVTLAGLIFQVVMLVLFCLLFADYLVACRRTSVREKITRRIGVFLAFLFIATVLILVRCSYRIEELKEGYFSPMFRNEPLFIALESCVMVVAVFCLVIGNPAIGLKSVDNAKNATSISTDFGDNSASGPHANADNAKLEAAGRL